MFALLVEDDPGFVRNIKAILSDLHPGHEIIVARSRDSASDAITARFFDLIILDLKIPTIDGALDANPVHGHSVFAHACSHAPGTPIFVLTGSPAEDFIAPMLKQAEQVDIWSQGTRVSTVNFLPKFKIDECPDALRPVTEAVQALTETEVDRGSANLDIREDRLIRIFARRYGGARCVVSQLGGGLSGAKVLRITVTDKVGAPVHDAVAKLGSRESVRDEERRFDRMVSRLAPEATPRKLATLEYGAGSLSGVFYSLAGGAHESLFSLALSSRAGAAVSSAEAATKRWTEGVPETRRTVRDIRRRILSDQDLSVLRQAYPIAWVDEFEARSLQTRWACIHGDLHGSNVLVSSNDISVLIDYGDVDEGPASLDPITLELSILFHPQGPSLGNWPTNEAALALKDSDVFARDCPCADYVLACRQWARRVAAGNREMAASAYAYVLRQLKYGDTRKDLVLALLAGVRTWYDGT